MIKTTDARFCRHVRIVAWMLFSFLCVLPVAAQNVGREITIGPSGAPFKAVLMTDALDYIHASPYRCQPVCLNRSWLDTYPAGTKLRPVLEASKTHVVQPTPPESSPQTVLVLSPVTGYGLLLVEDYQLAGGKLDYSQTETTRQNGNWGDWNYWNYSGMANWIIWTKVNGNTPASEVANKLWSTILTKCLVPKSKPAVFSWFYFTHEYQGFGPIGEHREGYEGLYEYRNATVETRMRTISETEQLNGLQADGYTRLEYSSYRRSDYEPGRPRGWSTWYGAGEFHLVVDDLKIGMKKINDQWLLSINPAESHAAARSCEVLTSSNPFAPEDARPQPKPRGEDDH